MLKPKFDAEPVAHLGAMVAAAAMLLLLGKMLLRLPELPSPADDGRMALRFLVRTDAVEPEPLPVPVSPSQPMPAASSPSPASRGATAVAGAPATPAPVPGLYDAQGKPRLPTGVAVDPLDPGATAPPGLPNERELRRARQLLERPRALEYEPTRFAKDWISDGDVADVTQQAIGRQMKKLNEKIFGADIQPAVARPPPEVRFNPALHERSADLGSEATGDAYKAAPIAFEKAPDLKGEASGRIRAAIGALESRYPRCAPAQLRTWMAPVLAHLDELQRVEYAYAHGADPVMAAHTLPRAADSAYDLARRALWYAEKKMAGCSD